jgi:hypothetical protein
LTVQTPWPTFFPAERNAVMLSKRSDLIAGMRALTGLGGVGATAGFPEMRERTPAGVISPFTGALTEGTPDPITSSVRLHVY